MSWENCRIKDVATIISQKSNDLALPYIALDNIISWDGTFVPSDSTSDGNSNFCKAGDVLFGKLRPYLAKGYIATKDSLCSPEFIVLRPVKGNNAKFLLYFLLSPQYIHYIRNQVAGTKMPRTNASQVGASHIYLPNTLEQEAIAAYLDKECAKIGREVELLERKADCYRRLRRSLINQAVTRGLNPNVPMKRTKYGLMPEHWKESRLKDLYFMYGGITGKKGNDFLCEEDTPNAKPFIKYTNILNNFPIQNCNHGLCIIYDSENQNCVEKNDLLFLMSSEDYESIGLASVVDKTMGEIYLNSFCKGLHLTTKEVLSKFIALQLRAEIIHDALRYEARGFTRINLKVDKVMCHKIFLPHIDEQREIVEYIDKKCSQIDTIIAKIEAKIERLKELKRSLINEVVTGRRAINSDTYAS